MPRAMSPRSTTRCVAWAGLVGLLGLGLGCAALPRPSPAALRASPTALPAGLSLPAEGDLQAGQLRDSSGPRQSTTREEAPRRGPSTSLTTLCDEATDALASVLGRPGTRGLAGHTPRLPERGAAPLARVFLLPLLVVLGVALYLRVLLAPWTAKQPSAILRSIHLPQSGAGQGGARPRGTPDVPSGLRAVLSPPPAPEAVAAPTPAPPPVYVLPRVKHVPSIPPCRLGLSPVTLESLPHLIHLHSLIFPQLRFDGNFLTGVLQSSIVGYFVHLDDQLVGVFSLRMAPPAYPVPPRRRAYLSSLGLLPEFQGRGLGRLLLHRALNLVAAEDVPTEVLLHVHVSNAHAQDLYASEGFSTLRLERGYYAGYLSPPDAYLMGCVLPPRGGPP
eukprot:EG_transcript_10692